jgi:hypothetical protein
MDENKKLGEEQLKEVAGGGSAFHRLCFFTPTGKKKEVKGNLWAECASNCGNIGKYGGCDCHGSLFVCENKWHLIDSVTEELLPRDWANHADKLKSNNYNT